MNKLLPIATAVATILGWLLITEAIALVAPARIVWSLSSGLFCLTVPGLKNIVTIAGDGLYALMQEDSNDA